MAKRKTMKGKQVKCRKSSKARASVALRKATVFNQPLAVLQGSVSSLLHYFK